jgi:hypothetical protein
MLSLAVALLTTVAGPGHTDSTLAVSQGMRLEVSNFQGQVYVSAWNKDEVRVQADHGRRTHVEFSLGSRTLKVEASGNMGPPSTTDFDISVPSWLPVTIQGPMSDVTVAGVEAPIKAETVNGNISVDGGRGYVELSSVQGQVEVRGTRGHLKLSSINEGVTVSDAGGQIEAETVNGEIILDHVRCDALTVSSVDGDVWFDGEILQGGRYHLESHSGSVQMVCADKPDANLSVSTYSGEFSSDFDLAVHGQDRRERMQFTLGHGGSDVSLESFDGNIQLLKSSLVQAIRGRIKAEEPVRPEAAPAPEPQPQRTPRPARAPKSPTTPQAPTPPNGSGS